MAQALTTVETMRLIGVMLCACVVTGCAARAKRCCEAPASPPAPETTPAIIEAEARTASALVFDPPVTAGMPPLELARAEREPAAFVAYDEVFSTYFYLRMDDHQKIDADGRSERRVITETFGVSRR